MELSVTLSVFFIILFSVYMVHETNQASYSQSEMRMDIQQNARVALATMERELRMAGYGVPKQLAGVSMIADARPKTITFRADLRNVISTLTSAAASGNSDLSVSTTAGIANGDAIYLTNGSKAEALTVPAGWVPSPTSLSTSTRTNAYASGSRVFVPRDVRFTIAGGQLLREERIPNGAWPGSATVLADRIVEQDAFRYYNAANAEIASNNPVASPDANIRRIRITLNASGTPSGLNVQSYTLISDVKPRNLE